LSIEVATSEFFFLGPLLAIVVVSSAEAAAPPFLICLAISAKRRVTNLSENTFTNSSKVSPRDLNMRSYGSKRRVTLYTRLKFVVMY
jgi:hypothetical protein